MEGRWSTDCNAERVFPLACMEITPLPCFLDWKEGDYRGAKLQRKRKEAELKSVKKAKY